jgi:hypothetical protein
MAFFSLFTPSCRKEVFFLSDGENRKEKRFPSFSVTRAEAFGFAEKYPPVFLLILKMDYELQSSWPEGRTKALLQTSTVL